MSGRSSSSAQISTPLIISPVPVCFYLIRSTCFEQPRNSFGQRCLDEFFSLGSSSELRTPANELPDGFKLWHKKSCLFPALDYLTCRQGFFPLLFRNLFLTGFG